MKQKLETTQNAPFWTRNRPENNENSDQALNVAANAKLEKAKAAEKKKKADKKAKKKPNQGTTRCSGEFWWA